MNPNDASKLIRKAINQGVEAPSQHGLKYGIPGDGQPRAVSCFGSGFVADGNGVSLEILALLLTGDRAAGALLSPLNGNVPASAQLPPGTTVILPNGMTLPSWQDQYRLDPFDRTYLFYWTARALEAHFNAPGSSIGVLPVAACDLGKDGKPGQCCDPTSDPFPSKPYFYNIPEGKGTADVVRDFGRPDTGWIELRRANADDPDGFVKLDNGWCVWKRWEPGKRLRIPGSWPEEGFTDAVWDRLVDGNGYQFRLSDLAGYASLFMKGMPWRWTTPIHMMIECGRQLWLDPSIRPGLDVDASIAKEIIKRSFLAK